MKLNVLFLVYTWGWGHILFGRQERSFGRQISMMNETLSWTGQDGGRENESFCVLSFGWVAVRRLHEHSYCGSAKFYKARAVKNS